MNIQKWCEEVLIEIKDESKFKKSDFMDRIIDFKESIFKYYKKHRSKNRYFKDHSWYHYIFDIFDLYRLKRFLKKNKYEQYINKYLNENEGWYKPIYIPTNKNGLEIEIINSMDKPMNAYMCGYGFREKGTNPKCTFGWMCWVKCWKFINDKDNNVERIEYRKGFKKKKNE